MPPTNTAPAADPAKSAERAEEAMEAFDRLLAEFKTMCRALNEDAANARARYAGWLDKILEEAKELRQEYAAWLDPEGIAHLDDLYTNIEAVRGVIVRNLKS